MSSRPADESTTRGAPAIRAPRWVRAIDALSIVVLGVAMSVVLFGGFRVMVAGTRLSVTDWWRPALWATLLVAGRHWAYRHDPVWRRVGDGLAGWWRSPDTRAILPIHLATRLGVLAVGFLAVVLVGFPTAEPPPLRIYNNALLDLPARWDAGWYLAVASEGYRWSPENVEGQQNIAFFPAFPLTIRYASVILGRQPLWAGVLISFVAFFWALRYLLRLAREHLGDEDRANTTVVLLASYPFALFFSAPYTEALFLLAMVAAVYHFRRSELWPAAGWGLLAGLTRPNGAFLSVVLGLMVLEEAWRAWRSGVPFRWVEHLDRLATAAAPGMGMLFYSTFILFLTGAPFQWALQNAAWGRTYRPLDTLITDRVEYIRFHGLYGYAATQPLDMFYLASVVFILLAVWPVYRRFGLPYAVLLLVNLLPPMMAGGLLSIGRVTSTLFPAFLWLGAALPARHRTPCAVAFAVLQGFAAVMFFTWRPLY
jgi:hypothetical protein